MSNEVAMPYSGLTVLNSTVGSLFKPYDAFQKAPGQIYESSTILSGVDTQKLAQQVSDLKMPVSPSAFTTSLNHKLLEELVFDATAAVKILTAQVAMHLDKVCRDKIFFQIDSLHELGEWEPDDKPIQQSSYETFLKAILQIKPHRHPGLGLTSDGMLIAAWTTDKDRLTVEFLPKNHVRWVITQFYNGEPERASGKGAVARLVEYLSPYHPENWFA